MAEAKPVKLENILTRLKEQSNPKAVAGMGRFGINPRSALGVSIPELRRIAREVGLDHGLAQKLWTCGIHEARILASMVDDPEKVTERQLEAWVKDFDSWDVCDQTCSNLFDKTKWAFQKAKMWGQRREEFVKRAGFVLMACLAVHDKISKEETFHELLRLIKRGATDERNFVKKAVNWALRQIGKRNAKLNRKAIQVAQEIQRIDSKGARWIASDALRELKSESVQKRLQRKVKA